MENCSPNIKSGGKCLILSLLLFHVVNVMTIVKWVCELKFGIGYFRNSPIRKCEICNPRSHSNDTHKLQVSKVLIFNIGVHTNEHIYFAVYITKVNKNCIFAKIKHSSNR